MKSIKSKLARTAFSRLAAGCVLVAGFALAAVSPALADGWHGDRGGYYHGGYYGGYYRGPVYVAPRPVIVAPRPVVVAPPAPVYYQPAPVYYQPAPVIVAPPAPAVSVVIPLRFH